LSSALQLKNHADGNVVDPRLMPQNQFLQRGPIAVLGLVNQVGIRSIAVNGLGEGIEHHSAPWSAGTF
jgi:hypothetical protein